jgi:DNA-directed RNA polymerase sigma subunit (sigma70/sigma32)
VTVAQPGPEQFSDADEEGLRAQAFSYRRLSEEEQARLLASRGQAREAANRTLIEHHLYLVYEAAAQRRELGVPFSDLFQEGTVGLISAVEHYQAGASGLTARLRQVIAATMDDVVAQTEDAQRNDQAFVTACRALEAAERLLLARLQRPPTALEVGRLLNWEESRVTTIRDLRDSARAADDAELLEYLDDLGSDDGSDERLRPL